MLNQSSSDRLSPQALLVLCALAAPTAISVYNLRERVGAGADRESPKPAVTEPAEPSWAEEVVTLFVPNFRTQR